MADHEVERASTTEGLPVSPSLAPSLEAANVPSRSAAVDRRTVLICVVSIALAAVAALAAEVLVRLIRLFTNISFYGRFSVRDAPPVTDHLGLWVILVPVVG